MRPERVSILGGGIGGLATALALARRGIEVELFEQAPVLTAVGAGIQISPNGVAVLHALGLYDQAVKTADYPNSIQLRSGRSGRRVARIPLGIAAERRWGWPYWQFHRVDLLDLLAAAAVTAGVRLSTGMEMLNIRLDGPVAHLQFADGTSTATRCLVAADGIRSRVRSQLFTDTPPRFTGHVAWRAVLPADVLATPHPTATLVHLGAGRHTVSYPIAGSTLINFVAVEERRDWTEEGWSIAGDPQDLRAAFGHWPEPVRSLVQACQKTYLCGLFDHPPLAAWYRGPVALLGDAVHPMLPFLAQGATMALEDAFVLAREIATHPDLAQAFASYQGLRKARCTRTQRASAANAKIYHARNLVTQQATRAGLAAISGTLPTLLLSRFNWLYGADVTK